MIAFNNASLPILNIYKPLDVTGLSRVNEGPAGEIILIRGHFVPSISELSDPKLKFNLNFAKFYLFKIRPIYIYIYIFSSLFNFKCKISQKCKRLLEFQFDRIYLFNEMEDISFKFNSIQRNFRCYFQRDLAFTRNLH